MSLSAVWRAACTTKLTARAYVLEPGDFLLFEANLPHRWGNPGDEDARLLLVLQAPNDGQGPAREHFTDYPSVTYLE